MSPQFASHEALVNLDSKVDDVIQDHKELRDKFDSHNLELAEAMAGVKLQLQAIRWIGVSIAGCTATIAVALVLKFLSK